jgi:hypothetical protein
VETPSQQPGPLAFSDFLEHLRRQGFTIGIDHYLRLQRLLAALSGRCAPQDLKTLLCPVFATNEKEQQSFHRAFDSYFDLFQIPDESEGKSDSPPALADAKEEPAASTKSKWRFALIYISLNILLIMLIFWIAGGLETLQRYGLAPTATPLPTIEREPPTTPTTEVSPPEAFPEPKDFDPALTPTLQPWWKNAIDFVIAHRNVVRIVAVAIPLLCFLIYELIRYRRRKLILERARGRKPPRAWPIVAQSPELKDYRSELFYKATRGLRRRQVAEFHRLDVARTIAATIEARGYPDFQYRADSRAPEYLILVERASWRDHQSHLFDALARAMEREGLFTQRYFYDGDPRVCVDDTTNRAVHLTDLQKKYPSHRLLIFGDGARLIDPVSGRLASWAALLLEWPDRALLTPEARRGLREKTLADYFILLPATLEGLGELAEHFDLPAVAEFDSWELNGEQPPEPEGPVKIEALRSYLGEEAFQWLCACAVYPELHWDLTLHLGSLPRMGAGLISDENLLRLIRLQWFRAGSMPDELRLRLIGGLEPERERAVRSAIIELLEKNPAPQGTFAADARKLEIAAQRSWLSRDNRRELRHEVDEIKKFPPSDVACDYALVRFLESAPSSRLAVLLPQWLRRVFYEGGVPAFGARNGVRLVVTLVEMIAIWFGASILKPNDPESIKTQWSRVPIYDLYAERDRDGLLRVVVTAETPTEGWRIYTNYELQSRDTLEIRLLGIPPSNYGYSKISYPSAPTICMEDRNSEIRSIVVYGSTGARRLVIDTGATSARNVSDPPSQQTFQPTLQSPGEVSQPDGSSANSVRTPLGRVGLYDFQAKRSNDGLLRAMIVAETPSIGWRIYTYHELTQGDTLDIRLMGEPPSDYGVGRYDHPSAPTICVVDPNSAIRHIIVRALKGNWYLTIDSGPAVARIDNYRPDPGVTTPTPSPSATPPTLARFSVTPRLLDFGAVSVPDYKAQIAPDVARKTVTVVNTGGASYTVRRVAIGESQSNISMTTAYTNLVPVTSLDINERGQSNSFNIGSDSCSGANFQPGQRCSIEVIFSPKSPGRYTATLSINATAGQQTIYLNGVGVSQSQPGGPTITEFTASPASVAAGDAVTMCYGAQDAVRTTIDPDIGEVKPIDRNCFTYRVTRTTSYTLTATGRDGRRVSRQLTVRVESLPTVEITHFRAQPSSLPEAGKVQLCYGVLLARGARIDQGVGEIESSMDNCIYVTAKQTTTYTLTATGADGKTVTRSLTLRVGPGKAKN